MKESIKQGISFGITSGTITTLGLMMGLYAGTQSKMIVVGGVLTIAIADALSDALAMHVSEESKHSPTSKDLWSATFSTFVAKLIYALTFLIPVLIFHLKTAIIISIVYGFLMLSILSFKIAKDNKDKPSKVIFEHLLIAAVVLVITYYVGIFISIIFA
jgi:vacuolar iron transporter family protein